MVKITIKFYQQQCLDTHSKQFSKYVWKFKRQNNSFLQLKINDKVLSEPKNVADCLLSILNPSLTRPSVTPPYSVS
jgi:hypothetical protein